MFCFDLVNTSFRCVSICVSTSASMVETYVSFKLSAGINDVAIGCGVSVILFISSNERHIIIYIVIRRFSTTDLNILSTGF